MLCATLNIVPPRFKGTGFWRPFCSRWAELLNSLSQQFLCFWSSLFWSRTTYSHLECTSLGPPTPRSFSGADPPVFFTVYFAALFLLLFYGLPRWCSGKEPVCQGRRCNRHGFNPWAGKIPEVGDGKPLQHSCLENPMDRGAWWATVHGVAKRQTRLKWLNTHARVQCSL